MAFSGAFKNESVLFICAFSILVPYTSKPKIEKPLRKIRSKEINQIQKDTTHIAFARHNNSHHDVARV